MVPIRSQFSCRRALLLCVAAVLAAVVAGCGGAARTKSDCDQLLNEQKYSDVIKDCDNPYQRASAYLGQAGFDTFSLIESSADPGDVVAILGLTLSNIDGKRLLINKAVKEVVNPQDGSQAFALLTAAFLGMAVTAEEFLDNGQGGGTALDYNFEAGEVQAALQLQAQVPVVLVAPPPTDYFTAVTGGAAYTLDCTADVVAPACDDDPQTKVYADATGAGVLNTASPPSESANKSSVIGAVSGIDGGYPIQFLNLALPYSFASTSQDAVRDFLGHGGTAGVFDIGMGGYLQYLTLADNALAEFGGIPAGDTAISDDVDALVSQFDNGGKAASTGGTCVSGDALAAVLVGSGVSGLEHVYSAAAGTINRPAPSSIPSNYYNGLNLVKASDVSTAPAFNTLAPIPGGTAFASLSRYKVLYATTSGLGSFDATKATPRVDAAYSTFISEFENIPLVLPAVPTAGDGTLNVIELLCSAE